MNNRGEDMKKRLLVAIIIMGLYGIIYLLNSQFFDIYEPYYIYTVSWTTRQVLPIVAFITVLMTLLGKWRLTSFISFAGYISGIVFGELFGEFESDVPPQYLHYGWAIWGCVFILSVIAGIIIEKRYKCRYFEYIFKIGNN
ncbi:hypothetical protein RSJ42_09445 [Methanosarcina hadiensis]|uniref:hypothetical protein n=1 Tax=Methanosarcina hadiensis TaxID=3078083 RepID=UPI0039778A5A